MKTSNRLDLNSHQKQKGFSLLEILIAIGVFAVGALALAGLQTAVTNNSGNAKSRTVAANLAQAQMEKFRGFVSVGVNGNGDPAFASITSAARTSTGAVGGTNFYQTRVVTPYYWNGTAFVTTAPPSASNADFKKVVLTVDWVGPSGVGQSVVLTDAISSLSTAASGRTIAGGGNKLAPPVPYTPGARPDVAAIDLGNNRFKETLTAIPEVYSDSADGQFVMTGFDIITYSQDPNDNTSRFLRREENRVLNCECTLHAADANKKTFQPMVWTGVEYIEGNLISKPYGTKASGRTQDPLCAVCCQDHHDPSSADTSGVDSGDLPDAGRFKYDPWNSASVHPHYKKDGLGNLVVASTGDNYFEACRMIRSDGFFRVVQDVSVTNLVTLPEYFLRNAADISVFSSYVTSIVSSFMNAAVVTVSPPYPGTMPTVTPPNSLPNSTALPEPLDLLNPTSTSQQLRSRVVYIDYLTKQTRDLYVCLTSSTSTPKGADCDVPQIFNAFEIVPFFELNVGQLAEWWSPTPLAINVTNERLESGNSHSRGAALKTGNFDAIVATSSWIAPNNTGLTNTDPASPGDVFNPFSNPPQVTNSGQQADISISISGSGTPPNPGPGNGVEGDILAANGTQVDISNNVVMSGTGCQRSQNAFICDFSATSGNGSITISGYKKKQGNNWINNVCIPGYIGTTLNSGTSTETTTFTFSGLTSLLALDITIKKNGC